MKALAVALAALAVAPLAAAETVYRCGRTYQQSPCPGGQPVATDDARSEAQRRDAQAVARDQARLGATLERDRVAREKAAPPAAAVGIGSKPAEAASAPRKARHKRGRRTVDGDGRDDFMAVEPRRPKPRDDAR